MEHALEDCKGGFFCWKFVISRKGMLSKKVAKSPSDFARDDYMPR